MGGEKVHVNTCTFRCWFTFNHHTAMILWMKFCFQRYIYRSNNYIVYHSGQKVPLEKIKFCIKKLITYQTNTFHHNANSFCSKHFQNIFVSSLDRNVKDARSLLISRHKSYRHFHSICVQYVALWWKIQHAWICAFFIFSVSNISIVYKSRILLSIHFYF